MKTVINSLEEDFKALGLTGQTNTIRHYAGLSESADDNASSEQLTMAALKRIESMDTDSMSVEQLVDLIENLKNYDVDERDTKLVEATKSTFAKLEEMRLMKIKATAGGTKTRAAAGYQQKGGKVVRKSAAERRQTSITGRKYRKRAASKIAKYRNTRGARLMARRQARGLMPGANESLAGELAGFLGESVEGDLTIDQQIVESFGNVYELLEELLGEDVSDPLLESYQRCESAVLNGNPVEESYVAALKIVSRCLIEVDKIDVGN